MTQFTLEVSYHDDPLPWMNVEHPVTHDGALCKIGGSFGVRLVPTDNPKVFGLHMDNGLDTAEKGGFYFDKIILRGPEYMSIAPRVNHAIGWTSFAIYIGNGAPGVAEYFPPRQRKIQRFIQVQWWQRVLQVITEPWRAIYNRRPTMRKTPFTAIPKALAYLKAKYDAEGERMLKAMRTGVPDPGVDLHNLCGCWMPYDEMDKGYVSGKNIEPQSGAELSSIYRTIGHDLLMERMAISHVNAATGEPIHAQRQEYDCNRGWNVSTQLAEWCDPFRMQDDRRFPKNLNTGTCPYIDKLVPTGDATFYNARYLPIDCEHLVRATRHAKALAFLYNDKIAMLDLEMIAADAHMGVRIFDHDQQIYGRPVARYPDRGGCDRYGRGWAWSLNAIQATAYMDGAHLIVASWAYEAAVAMCWELERVQRPENGSYQHILPPPNTPGGYSPDPYFMPPQYGPSMPHDLPCVHVLEETYLGMCMMNQGHLRSGEATAAWMFKVQPRQWMAATVEGTPQVGEVESFAPWALLAFLADLSTMEHMSVPGGGPAGPNVLQSLLARVDETDAYAKAAERLEEV